MQKKLYIFKLNTLEIHRCVGFRPVRSLCGKVESDKTRKWRILDKKGLEKILVKEPARHFCKMCSSLEEEPRGGTMKKLICWLFGHDLPNSQHHSWHACLCKRCNRWIIRRRGVMR
jgi:hypothetical protein